MVKTLKDVRIKVDAEFLVQSEDGTALLTLREAVSRWGREFVADRLRELAEEVEDGATE
jgi:hypothetical protein